MFIRRKKKIKINNDYYNLKVNTYPNRQLCLCLENKKNKNIITLNVPNIKIGYSIAVINPVMANQGIIRILKKQRIIKNVISTINYNNALTPLVKINIGKLKEYDSSGVRNYQDNYLKLEVNYE